MESEKMVKEINATKKVRAEQMEEKSVLTNM
jgi:hypothetical protein